MLNISSFFFLSLAAQRCDVELKTRIFLYERSCRTLFAYCSTEVILSVFPSTYYRRIDIDTNIFVGFDFYGADSECGKTFSKIANNRLYFHSVKTGSECSNER